MKFKIINGKVFDPSQKINGQKKDIFVDDGRIVKPDMIFVNSVLPMMLME